MFFQYVEAGLIMGLHAKEALTHTCSEALNRDTAV
jgi:hypothetical protein